MSIGEKKFHVNILLLAALRNVHRAKTYICISSVSKLNSDLRVSEDAGQKSQIQACKKTNFRSIQVRQVLIKMRLH